MFGFLSLVTNLLSWELCHCMVTISLTNCAQVCFLFYLYWPQFTNEDVWKVLRRYHSSIVQVIPWALPGHLPNDPERRSQSLHDETWQRLRLEVLPYDQSLLLTSTDFFLFYFSSQRCLEGSQAVPFVDSASHPLGLTRAFA